MTTSFSSSSSWKCLPPKNSSNLGNRWKSLGPNSGLYGGCWKTFQPKWWSKAWVAAPECAASIIVTNRMPLDNIPCRLFRMAHQSWWSIWQYASEFTVCPLGIKSTNRTSFDHKTWSPSLSVCSQLVLLSSVLLMIWNGAIPLNDTLFLVFYEKPITRNNTIQKFVSILMIMSEKCQSSSHPLFLRCV